MTSTTATACRARPSWTPRGCCSPGWASPRPTCSRRTGPSAGADVRRVHPGRRAPRSATAPAAPTAPTGTGSSSTGATGASTNPPRRRSSSSPSTSSANVVARRNARGGRSAAEHLIAALRCLYRHAVADGLHRRAETTRPARSPNPDGCPAPAAPSPTPGSPRSTRSPPPPATTPPSTPCCCACTPRPPAAAAAPSPCARPTSTPTSA